MMKGLLLVLAFLPQVFATEERTLEKRSYRFHAGSTATKPAPLVIALHGAGSDAIQTEFLTGLSELADQKGFAVAYPNGKHRVWRFDERSEDIVFIRDLIDALVKSGEADPKRVYVTGISNGAILTHRLACDLSDRIAAIAPIAGTFPSFMSNRMSPGRPVPVICFHGTEDHYIGYDGTDFISKHRVSLGAEEAAAWWAKKNAAAGKPEVEKLPDSVDDGTTVERWTYAASEGGAPVIFYRIVGGGHTWPGSAFGPEKVLGRTSKEIQASELMWAFFEKFSLPETRK